MDALIGEVKMEVEEMKVESEAVGCIRDECVAGGGSNESGVMKWR